MLYELGVGDAVKAVTHRCTYPSEAILKPHAITSPIDSDNMTSSEIDAANSEMIKQNRSAFILDEQVIRQAKPDLIISQNTCDVCAAHVTHVGNAVKALGYTPTLYQMDPHTMQDILNGVTELAELVGKQQRGKEILDSLYDTLRTIKDSHSSSRPRVFPVEWTDPIYTAGHWIPDMIEMAGGTNLIGSSGDRSKRIPISDVQDADPDTIVTHVLRV